MIHKEDFVGASCDVCEEMFEANFTGYSFFLGTSALYEEMDEAGWHTTDDNNHYCPACHSIDDNDILIIKELNKTEQ